MSRLFAAAAVVAGVGGVAAPSHGAEFSTDAGGGALRNGYTNNALYAGSLGAEFTVGPTGLVVNSVGYYDGPNSGAGAEADGLLEGHEVGIFDAAGNLLTSATVPAGGGTLVGDFRYVPTTPVTLAAGTNYHVIGQVPTNSTTGDTFRDGSSGNVNQTDLTVVGGRYSGPPDNPNFNDGVFRFANTGVGPGLVYFGPSFQYELVPEPTGLSLLMLGGLALARRGRKALPN